MSDFVPVGKAADIEPGAWQKYQVGPSEVVVFNVDGQFHAIDDTCPHRGGPLSHGFLEGQVVYCPLHGWPFDVTTGEMPGAPEICVPRYSVRVDGEELLVSRQPAAPEPAGK
ncbi:MAG: Rieske 2Fe-2S domain-containing protein [Candidatus Sericytochromatia bacterium]|nr:Rieske 2Fe-2S domain-containing protein [Candidatus Tanganyikabacteria bacterium]